MTRAIDIPAGTQFALLTTTGEFELRFGQRCWVCVCACGKRRVVNGTHLRAGTSKSCGCINGHAPRLTHGHSRARTSGRASRTYTIWNGMRERCARPDPFYGGRGIRVCEAWTRFEQFLEDMGPCPSRRHSLDRIDSNGHYEAGNCRWATPNEQARNRRNSIRITLNGARVPLADACEAVGLPYSAVLQRVRAGWPDERALSQPLRVARRG